MIRWMVLISQIVVLSLMVSCSGSDEDKSIQERQEQIGHDAADAIKAPMEKAKNVQGLVDKHYAEKEKQSEQE